MRLKYILYILLLFPIFTSCNNEDDVDKIFVSGTWYMQNFYTSGWDKKDFNSSVPKYTSNSDITTIQAFTIQFENDGTFIVKTTAVSAALTGRWSADGKNRKISISFNNSPKVSDLAKEYTNALQDAQYYSGTGGEKGFLQLTKDKKAFIQFNHKDIVDQQP